MSPRVAKHTIDETLKAKEIEVLRLIATGNANKEVLVRRMSGCRRWRRNSFTSGRTKTTK